MKSNWLPKQRTIIMKISYTQFRKKILKDLKRENKTFKTQKEKRKSLFASPWKE